MTTISDYTSYNYSISTKPLLALSLVLIFSSSNHVEAFATNSRALLVKKTECSISLRASVEGTGTLVDTDGDCETASSALDWSFIDSAYLIHCPNGDPDGERIASTRSILKEVNLLDSTTVKEFDTDDEDRVRGCYNSHCNVFRDIIQKNSRKSISNSLDFLGIFQNNERRDDVDDLNVLIFEDNLYLNNGILEQESIDAISNFVLEYENEWDVIHLAYIPYVPDLKVSKTDDKRIVKLSTKNQQSALGTTAYVINGRAMRKIIEEDDRKGYTLSIPDAMAELFGESRYALNPTAFVRAPATKSLVNPQLDDLRSILFRPSVVSFVQQILISTGLSTTALLPLVILFLLSISITSISSSVHSAIEYLNYGTIDGPLIVPITSVVFSFFSLGLIIQGFLLAPKPNVDESE
jgi:GR25 family glycosyltransferase involved in LPS biosynthesis